MAGKVQLAIIVQSGALVLFLVISAWGHCPESWLEHGTSCYNLDSVTRTWDDGVARCERLGGQLMVIETQEENDFLLGSLRDQGKTWAWLGCSDRATEGQWLCYNEATDSLAFRNWAPNQPNNHGGVDDCMSFNMETGLWYDSKCGADIVYTVCEKTNPWKGEGINPTPSATPVACYPLASDGRLRV